MCSFRRGQGLDNAYRQLKMFNGVKYVHTELGWPIATAYGSVGFGFV